MNLIFITIEQFMFFLLNDSDAAPNIAISFTPKSIADCMPFVLGTKTGYDTLSCLLIFL